MRTVFQWCKRIQHTASGIQISEFPYLVSRTSRRCSILLPAEVPTQSKPSRSPRFPKDNQTEQLYPTYSFTTLDTCWLLISSIIWLLDLFPQSDGNNPAPTHILPTLSANTYVKLLVSLPGIVATAWRPAASGANGRCCLWFPKLVSGLLGSSWFVSRHCSDERDLNRVDWR